MRSKKAIKNVVASLIQQIITIVCGLILPKAIISSFGSNVNGLVSSITQFLTYIALLESGIGPVIKSTLYKPIANKDKSEIENILCAGQKFFKVIAYIFIIYLIILCFIYPKMVNSEFDAIFTVSLLLIISISTFSEYFLGMIYKLFLQADQRTYITANVQTITIILNTIISIILIRLGMSIQVVKLYSASIFIFRPIIQNIYVKKKYNINLKNVHEKYELKQKWDGLAQHIAAIVHENTDVSLLTLFSTTSEISVYTVYYFVVKGVKQLMQALTSGIDATFANMYVKGEHKNLNEKFKIYELVYFTIITIVFSITMVLILPFVEVYTLGINDANYYRPIFSYLIVISEYIWVIRLPYNSLTLAVGHFKETRKGAWVEAITNIVISTILVIKYGIIGVTIGTMVAMLIRTFEFMYHTSKYVLNRNQKYSIIHFLLSAVECVIVCLIINQIIINVKFNSYVIWIKYAIVSTIITSVLIVLINILFYRNELKNLLVILNKIMKRKKED